MAVKMPSGILTILQLFFVHSKKSFTIERTIFQTFIFAVRHLPGRGASKTTGSEPLVRIALSWDDLPGRMVLQAVRISQYTKGGKVDSFHSAVITICCCTGVNPVIAMRKELGSPPMDPRMVLP